MLSGYLSCHINERDAQKKDLLRASYCSQPLHPAARWEKNGEGKFRKMSLGGLLYHGLHIVSGIYRFQPP